MTDTYVLTTYARESENDPWTQTTVTTQEPFTKDDWQKDVVGTKEFFKDLGGTETQLDDYVIEYVTPNKLRKTICQLQDTKDRHEHIDQALIAALRTFTPKILFETLEDERMRFRWQENAEFLNQTTIDEVKDALKRIDPRIIAQSGTNS